MIEVASHQKAALAKVLDEARGRVILDSIEQKDAADWIQVDVPEDEYTMVIDSHGKTESPT